MNRLPGSAAVCGNKMRDRTGEHAGPYIVTGPVGADPLKSEHWNLRCPLCGHKPKTKDARGLAHVARISNPCAGCGGHAFREGMVINV